jgi:hypothetical protein
MDFSPATLSPVMRYCSFPILRRPDSAQRKPLEMMEDLDFSGTPVSARPVKSRVC